MTKLSIIFVRKTFAYFRCVLYLFILVQIFPLYAGATTDERHTFNQFKIGNPKIRNDSSSASFMSKSEGWLLISEPGTTPVIYYAPLSIKTVKDAFVSVQSLINYISDEGSAESLLGVTLYDCAMGTKQEQSTVQYSKHWADGDVVLEIGLEEPWELVKINTEGMRLMKTVCDLR